MIINDCVLNLENSIDLEPGAATWIDQSRYKNNGTFGAGAAAPTWIQLPSGLWVLSFDATDDVLTVANDASLEFGTGQDFAIGFWYRRPAATVNYYFMGKYDGTAPYILFRDQGGNWSFAVADGVNSDTAQGPAWFVIGRWYFLLGQRDADGNTSIFTNGVLGGVPVATTSLDMTTECDFKIGFLTPLATSGCSVSHLRVWRHVLSAGQVRNHYEKTKHWFGVE